MSDAFPLAPFPMWACNKGHYKIALIFISYRA